MPTKPTYWVRSRQANEISDFARMPVPAHFNSLEDAKQYRQELNFNRGPFHPGYFIEEQKDIPPVFSAGIPRS